MNFKNFKKLINEINTKKIVLVLVFDLFSLSTWAGSLISRLTSFITFYLASDVLIVI